MSIFAKLFGNPNEKIIKKYSPFLDKINSLEPELEKLSDDELKGKTGQFRKMLNDGKSLDDILPEAFAVVREASKRTLKMRHFDVQLLGGIVIHQGNIAEMKTGEGKTLVATLPVYLNALSGKGVHVVTVNDYLAERDAAWMGEIYKFLGMTVGVTKHGQEAKEKIAAYAADITYGTNNEFGFDYLRDNMAGSLSTMAQRELHYAIVDEVDSILIDEARTPLIISAPDAQSTDKYRQFSQIIKQLRENEDYNVDEKLKSATLTERGIRKLEKILNVENIYQERGIETVHHMEQALKAQTLFQRDRDYVVKNNEVIIVDEFTGRLMPGRRFSEGLHQAIEAKEGVEVRRESKTMATITFQNYFRMYKKLSGMTGTAATSAEEFASVYNLEVVEIPTHRPMIREDLDDLIYRSELGKFQAVAREIKIRHEKGQPVLVGTISIEKNERLAEMLKREGVPHNILNAKNHEKEAEIISQAGRYGAVTVATNMAGRGVDIVLGGNPPDDKEAQTIKDLGGLHVIGTERHEARRIDNQLRGRTGRQGDPGSTQFYVSTEDDLLRLFGSDRIKALMAGLNLPEDQPIQNGLITRSLESAQKKVEGNNYDLRKHILEYDDVMNKHREIIYRRRRGVLDAWELDKLKIKKEKLGLEINEEQMLASLVKAGNKGLRERVMNIIKAEIEQLVSRHTMSEDGSSWNTEEIFESVKTIYPASDALHGKLEEIKKDRKSEVELRTDLIDYLNKEVKEYYNQREQQMGEEVMRQIERMVLLRTIDSLWIQHLDNMVRLREGIGLRGYAQRDPLVEYKKEGFAMFQGLLSDIQNGVVYTIFKVNVVRSQPSPMERKDLNMAGAEKGGASSKPQIKNKVGRNDPCPCGSGKKYKKCCGQNS